MHNHAAMIIDPAAATDWNGAAIPAAAVEGWCAFRVKCAKDASAVSVALDLPPMGRAIPGAIATGPREWFLIAPESEREILAARINAVSGAYAVEVSDSLVILNLENGADTMARLTGIDPASFGAGRAAVTKLAGIAVVIKGMDSGDVQLMFDISYSRHIRLFLDYAI